MGQFGPIDAGLRDKSSAAGRTGPFAVSASFTAVTGQPAAGT